MITRTDYRIVLVATALLAGMVSPVSAQNGAFRVLHAFDGDDGDEPTFLVQREGSLYGVTFLGGPVDAFKGVLYKIDEAGTFTIVHAFTDTPDGAQPSKLFLGRDGNIYGLTASGGAFQAGTVYRVDSADNYSIVTSFDGLKALGPTFLLKARDGNFYGTASLGGNPDVCINPPPRGTLFRMTPGGQVNVLHTFCREIDGELPNSLVEADDGLLYGTCLEDGPFGEGLGNGTFWRSDFAGNFELLHVFGPTTLNGDEPMQPNGIVQHADGFFYGTADEGGSGANGAIFRADKQGNIETIHSFNVYAADGGDPESNFLLAADGFFYGTASTGGLPVDDFNRAGVVFRADTAGHVWVLHTFTGFDGFSPQATPVLGTPGRTVFATTIFEGPQRHGVTVSMGLARTTPIRGLRLDPPTVVGGQSAQATLQLRSPAPAGGLVVQLFTPNSLLMPQSVTVPEGQSTARFMVRATPTTVDYEATVMAYLRDIGMSSPLQVLASPQP